VDEPDPIGNHETRLGMPARVVEDEKDDAPNARAGLLREGVQKRLKERLGDAVRNIPEGLAGRRRDEGSDIEPFITGRMLRIRLEVMARRKRALSSRRPDAAQHRFQADPVLIGCKDFDRRIGIFGLFRGDRLAKLFLKAAASSGAADFGFFGRGFWIVQPIACNASPARCANTEARPNSCAIHTAILGVVHTPPSGGGSTSALSTSPKEPASEYAPARRCRAAGRQAPGVRIRCNAAPVVQASASPGPSSTLHR
jgi:hypothetical protein